MAVNSSMIYTLIQKKYGTKAADKSGVIWYLFGSLLILVFAYEFYVHNNSTAAIILAIVAVIFAVIAAFFWSISKSNK